MRWQFSWSVVFHDDVGALFEAHRLCVVLCRRLTREVARLARVNEGVAGDLSAGNEAELNGASARVHKAIATHGKIAQQRYAGLMIQ